MINKLQICLLRSEWSALWLVYRYKWWDVTWYRHVVMIHPVTLSRVTCHVSHGTHQTQSATGRGVVSCSRASVINCGYCLQKIMTEKEGADYDKMTLGYKWIAVNGVKPTTSLQWASPRPSLVMTERLLGWGWHYQLITIKRLTWCWETEDFNFRNFHFHPNVYHEIENDWILVAQ